MITIGKIDSSRFRAQITQRSLNFIRDEGLQIVADVVIDKTISTTTSGINPYQYPRGFAPYSERYRKWKLKTVGSASVVNLVLHNSMVASLFLKKNTNGFSGLVTPTNEVGENSKLTNREKAIANANTKDRRFLQPNAALRGIMKNEAIEKVKPKLFAFLKKNAL